MRSFRRDVRGLIVILIASGILFYLISGDIATSAAVPMLVLAGCMAGRAIEVLVKRPPKLKYPITHIVATVVTAIGALVIAAILLQWIHVSSMMQTVRILLVFTACALGAAFINGEN
jgi:hypothetical protein